MGSITQSKLAFYGNREDMIELEELTNGEDNSFLGKIIPIPGEVLEKLDKEIFEWKEKNWGVKWCLRTHSEITHMETYSIFRLDLTSPYQPPLKIFDKIYAKFIEIKSICLSKFDTDNSVIVVRRDPNRGFQQCINYYADCEPESNEEEFSHTFEVNDDFIIELGQDRELSDACGMIGITILNINNKII